MSDLVYPRADFEALEARHRSPEWDYGVHWRLTDSGPDFPRYRLSWIVETGELYAVAQAGPDSKLVHVLGKIEKVGDYPYPGTRDLRGDSWTRFSVNQDVERVLEGWADDPQPSLDWVRIRVAVHGRQIEVNA